MKKICRDCFHGEDVHNVDRGVCACGCVRLRPVDFAAREARKRTWIVSVKFFVRNRWIDSEQRVKASGQGGAAMQAIRAAKKAVLKPRQRTEQVRVTITPVKGSGRK